MDKSEKTIVIGTVVAELGIVIMAIAGFNDRNDIAAISFFTAGIAAGVVLITVFLKNLRRRRFGF